MKHSVLIAIQLITTRAALQTCGYMKDAFTMSGCCGASLAKGTTDEAVMPNWSTRRARVELQMTTGVNYTDRDTAVVQSLMGLIARRPATSSDIADLASLTLPQKIERIGYTPQRLALNDAAVMSPDTNGAGVGKAIIVVGGGFATEACMAFLRTGGHCYFGSRTADKQSKILASITSPTAKAWSTARYWTEIDVATAQRLYMHGTVGTVDVRDLTSTVAWLSSVAAHARTNGLMVVGAFLSTNAQRLPTTMYKVHTSSPVVDASAHPDFYNNTHPFAHPDQLANHYYGNMYFVDAMNIAFAGRQANMSIVLTGSHVTLYDAAKTTDIKRSFNPLAGASIDHEYVQAKKLVQEVRLAAAAYGFMTNVLHPIGCMTDWYETLSSASSFLPVVYGVTGASSSAHDAAMGQLMFSGSIAAAPGITDATLQQRYTNIRDYWSTTEGLALRTAQALQLGSSEPISVEDMTGAVMMSMPEIFHPYLAAAGVSPMPSIIKWPRAGRVTNGKYEKNDYATLTLLRFMATTIQAQAAEAVENVNGVIQSCVGQFIDEPFCVLSGNDHAYINTVLTVLYAAFGTKGSPIAPPFVIGFAAATALMKGLDNTDAYQYGMIGPFLSDTNIGPEHLGVGSATQDADALKLYLDKSSSSASNRRYVHNSTASLALWC